MAIAVFEHEPMVYDDNGILAPASKAAIFNEAIRKQREKDGL